MALQYRLSLVGKIAFARRAAVSGFLAFSLASNCWNLPATQAQEKQRESATPASKAPAVDEKQDQDSSQEALNIYADAANFQNNTAFELAIAEWKKLIVQFPSDAIISKAQHYLGVCYLRLPTPDYSSAIAAFEQALKDKKLEVREESLVNLGWSLYMRGREVQGDARKNDLEQATRVFKMFLADYSDGSFADKAMFYAGESNYMLGRGEEASKYYGELVNSKTLSKSPIRPDALYAMGVNFEDMKQDARARDVYNDFLKQYADHKLGPDVRLRQAELALKANKPEEAVKLLKGLVDSKQSSLPDYVLYRYGFALAKIGKFDESSAMFKRLGEEFPESQYAANANLKAGQTLMREKKYEEASKYFKRLLPNRDESAAESAHWLCQIHLLQRKIPDAISVARDALTWAQKTNSYVALQMDLAEALLEQPETKSEARAIFEDVANNYPDDALASRATYNAAFSSLQTGVPAEAKRWSDLFAQKFPKDPLAPDSAYVNAEATLLLGKFAEAADAYAKLVDQQKSNPLQPNWQLRLATARFMSAQYDVTIQQLNQLLPSLKQPNMQAEAHFLLGACSLQTDKPAEAIAQFDKSLAIAPKWSQADEVGFLKAQAQARSGDRTKAKETYRKLLSDFPESRFKDQATFRLGQLALSNSDFDEAIQHFDSLIKSSKLPPLVENATLSKAAALIKKSDFKQTLELVKPLMSDGRNDGVGNEARLATAISLRGLSEYQKAIDILVSMSEGSFQGDSMSNILRELGETYTAKKDFASAEKTYTRILEENPKYFLADKVLYDLGWAQKELDKKEAAKETFRKLIETYPNSEYVADANFQVGQAEYSKQQFDSAVKAYSVAFSKATDDDLKERAIHKLGWSYFKQKDFTRASREFGKQVEQHPGGRLLVDALFMQAECSFKEDQFAEAWPVFQKSLTELEKQGKDSKVGEDIQALIYLHGAQSARELKKWAPATQWLNTFLTKFGSSAYVPQAMYELALCNQNQQKTAEALKLYQTVAEKYRTDVAARARFMMGEIFFGQRDYAKAIPEYQRVMYGYGSNQAPPEIKNWQARSAFEAGRCAEQLVGDLKGDRRSKAVKIATDFYQYIIDSHPEHELVSKSKQRIDELSKL